MDRHNKVRVTVNHQPNTEKKHDLEYILTPKGGSGKKRPTMSKQPLFVKMLKPILLAITLGVLFGVVLVHFFSDLTPSNDTTPVPVDQEENETEGPNDDPNESNNDNSVPVTTFEVTGKAYDVIQFGVFSSVENANDYSNVLSNQGIPTVVTLQDGNYYVLSTLINSMGEQDEARDWLEEKGLEYMEEFMFKSWDFSTFTTEVSEEHQDWLDHGLTLIEIGESESDWIGDIQTWIDDSPSGFESERLILNANQLVEQYGQQSDREYFVETIRLNILLFFNEMAEN